MSGDGGGVGGVDYVGVLVGVLSSWIPWIPWYPMQPATCTSLPCNACTAHRTVLEIKVQYGSSSVLSMIECAYDRIYSSNAVRFCPSGLIENRGRQNKKSSTVVVHQRDEIRSHESEWGNGSSAIPFAYFVYSIVSIICLV